MQGCKPYVNLMYLSYSGILDITRGITSLDSQQNSLSLLLSGPSTEDNFFEWEAVVTGPENTPFQVDKFLIIFFRWKRKEYFHSAGNISTFSSF